MSIYRQTYVKITIVRLIPLLNCYNIIIKISILMPI